MDDLRVKYVTDRNSLMEEEFTLIWNQEEDRIYDDSFFKIDVEVKKDIETIVDGLSKTFEDLKKIHLKSNQMDLNVKDFYDVSNLFEKNSEDLILQEMGKEDIIQVENGNNMLKIPMMYMNWLFGN